MRCCTFHDSFSSNHPLITHSLGTFYNATSSPDRKRDIKEWAWKHYPQAYEDLLKLGTYRVIKYDEYGEERRFDQPEALFKIGPIGRDVEA